MPHRLAAFTYDMIVTALTVLLAFAVRVGFDRLPGLDQLVSIAAAFVCVAALAYPLSGVYRASWRYTSFQELFAILRGVTFTVLGSVVLIFLIFRGDPMPRAIPVLVWFFLIVGLGAGRLALRVIREIDIHLPALMGQESKTAEKPAQKVPVLIYGFGDDAELLIRSMERNRQRSEFVPVGIIDDQPKNWGRRLRGVPVIGSLDLLGESIARMDQRPKRLVIMNDVMNRAIFRGSLRQAMKVAETENLAVSRFSGVADLVSSFDDNNAKANQLRIDAMLNRELVSLDLSGIEEEVASHAVIVTGAGGSIGSEIVRQIVALKPSRLVLVDNSELALYTIDQEITPLAGDTRIDPVLCDIRNKATVDRLVSSVKPQVIFHAAALKHVPLVEANPMEGMRTNVFGTINVARAARDNGVKAFVQISTDKAVRPTNVMGATKKLGEMFAQTLDLQSTSTRFVTVRFGNVLGSTGSVVPLFRRQIAAGGPITVTHPEITRYFMTIQEAVQLVLKASAYGLAHNDDRGKIFVLEMGEPVKIADLAAKMIRMAGLEPDVDIEIRYTGLRPGEKLYEELFNDAEAQSATQAEGVMVTSPEMVESDMLKVLLADLQIALDNGNEAEALRLLKRAVPGFTRKDDKADMNVAVAQSNQLPGPSVVKH